MSIPRSVNRLVITGGSGDLASAIGTAFDDPDWIVERPDRHTLDVCDVGSVSSYFEMRGVDLLVCAAGVTHDVPIARLSEESWDHVMAVNYHGAKNCAESALPNMIARGSGSIIFISSYSALHPPVGQAAYAAAKAALLGLTKDLARRWGIHGVRVNAILPGFIETRMTDGVSLQRRTEILADHALGRYNTPASAADFIRHLQERMPHTSGQYFQLDSRAPID